MWEMVHTLFSVGRDVLIEIYWEKCKSFVNGKKSKFFIFLVYIQTKYIIHSEPKIAIDFVIIWKG